MSMGADSGGMGQEQNGGWARHEANRPQTRRSDSTYPIIHTALGHSRGIMGFLSVFFPLIDSFVTDSYLH